MSCKPDDTHHKGCDCWEETKEIMAEHLRGRVEELDLKLKKSLELGDTFFHLTTWAKAGSPEQQTELNQAQLAWQDFRASLSDVRETMGQGEAR